MLIMCTCCSHSCSGPLSVRRRVLLPCGSSGMPNAARGALRNGRCVPRVLFCNKIRNPHVFSSSRGAWIALLAVTAVSARHHSLRPFGQFGAGDMGALPRSARLNLLPVMFVSNGSLLSHKPRRGCKVRTTGAKRVAGGTLDCLARCKSVPLAELATSSVPAILLVPSTYARVRRLPHTGYTAFRVSHCAPAGPRANNCSTTNISMFSITLARSWPHRCLTAP